ncbi:hypothetical protein L484_024971 [Morus notabilis]|uniref:Uncharacterized protein n=1 Tax=Morus notabilis TaxID=981085 RepID=W9R6U3_9ROSA|nr:hypothetical protein L484_024971 [Morus notabilis]
MLHWMTQWEAQWWTTQLSFSLHRTNDDIDSESAFQAQITYTLSIPTPRCSPEPTFPNLHDSATATAIDEDLNF